MQQENAMMLF